MHKRIVIIQVHRMGKVEKLETLKAPPLMEVRALEISPYTNRSPEIYLTLRRYQGDIPSTDLVLKSGVSRAS
jgi:hypothetical protein